MIINRAIGNYFRETLPTRLRRAWTERHAYGVVLLYHRITTLDTDPWRLVVTPRHFAEHLALLTKMADVLPLSTLVARLGERRTTKRPLVAVTFDDGYADNLDNAEPLLAAAGIHAELFITTGQLRARREFWWDELEGIILRPGELPPSFSIEVAGKAHFWTLGSYSEEPLHRHSAWKSNQPPPTSRHAFYLGLYRLMRPMPARERDRLMCSLREWGASAAQPRSSHRTLTQGELQAVSKRGVFKIGAHTESHPVLARLDPDEQRREIALSKQTLEKLIDSPVSTFSYPHGGRTDFTDSTVAKVSQLKFHCACTAIPEPVSSCTQPLLVPRIMVDDCDGDGLGQMLRPYFRGC